MSTSEDIGGPSSSASLGNFVTVEDLNRLVTKKISHIQATVIEEAQLPAKKLQESSKRSEKIQVTFMERQQELMERQQQICGSNNKNMERFLTMFMSQALPLQAIAPQMVLTSGQTPTSSDV